jgi:3-hydroxyacyl-[acyl-carrier-protein] dehydratase
MPPPLLFDVSPSDLESTVFTRRQIYLDLPQRFEFQLLDGVSMLDAGAKRMVAYADLPADAWWVRGHLPGRPLLPGVLMLEMAGQTSAVAARHVYHHADFLGFGGVDDCKFRESVVPPARMYILCTGQEYRGRRIISKTQGLVDGKLIFEATITGLTL